VPAAGRAARCGRCASIAAGTKTRGSRRRRLAGTAPADGIDSSVGPALTRDAATPTSSCERSG
jgi:hypothetical protein